MQSVLGASWMTTLVGYVVIVLTVANQVYSEQGLPANVHEWVGFIGGLATGVGIALAKDFNKSNSPHAQPVAAVVPTALVP